MIPGGDWPEEILSAGLYEEYPNEEWHTQEESFARRWKMLLGKEEPSLSWFLPANSLASGEDIRNVAIGVLEERDNA